MYRCVGMLRLLVYTGCAIHQSTVLGQYSFRNSKKGFLRCPLYRIST